MVLALALVGGVMWYFTGKMPKKFKSKAQFATGITEGTEISLNDTKVVSQPFAIAQKFNNLIEMMRSKQCVSLVQYQLLLHDLTDNKPFRNKVDPTKIPAALKDSIIARLKIKRDSCEVLILTNKIDKDIFNLLKTYGYEQGEVVGKSTIRRIPESDFISLEVETENPELSSFIANTYVAEFMRFYEVQRSIKSAGSVNFFEKIARIKKKELDDKVNALKTYKLKNRVINLYEQTKSVVNQLSTIEIKREEENLKIPSTEKVIQEVDDKFTNKEKKYYEVYSSKINPLIEDKKQKINELNAKFIAGNLTDKSLQDSVALLRTEMETLIRRAADEAIVNPNAVKKELIFRKLNAELDREMAIKAVKSIDTEIERLQKVITSYAPMEASIGALEREILVASEVYLLVLNKWNVAQFAALHDDNTLNQVEYASPAERPESTKKIMILGLSLGLTVVLCLLVIIGMAYLDETLYNTQRLEQATGFKTLGFLPLLKGNEIGLKQLFYETPEALEAQVFTQNIRKIRQSLETKLAKGSVVLVCGTQKEEGKTTFLLSIAFALSIIGKKVLLLDTNFKSASLSSILGAEPRLIPAGTAPINEPQQILEGIFVLGTQIQIQTPKEIMLDRLSPAFWEDIRQTYDFIFMEGPSLHEWTDSRELAEWSDAIISVFSAHQTLSKRDEDGLAFLTEQKDKHIGAVLNAVTTREWKSLYPSLKAKKTNGKSNSKGKTQIKIA